MIVLPPEVAAALAAMTPAERAAVTCAELRLPDGLPPLDPATDAEFEAALLDALTRPLDPEET